MSDELTLLVIIGDTITVPSTLVAKAEARPPVRGASYEGRVIAEGGDAPYTYAVITGSLPAGVSLNTSTGQLSGTPTTQGWTEFEVEITDSLGATDSLILALTVTGGFGWLTREIPPAQHAIPYSTRFVATGGSPPYTISVTDGSPTGTLQLSGAGVGSYTIASPNAPTATRRALYTLRVTDSTGNFADREFTEYTLPPLQVTGTGFPNGLVGLFYQATLGWRYGIVQPYPNIDPVRQWAVTAGTIPDGLTLDSATGRLFGIPEVAGDYTFTLEISDSTGALVSTPATIEIFDVGGGGGGETLHHRKDTLVANPGDVGILTAEEIYETTDQLFVDGVLFTDYTVSPDMKTISTVSGPFSGGEVVDVAYFTLIESAGPSVMISGATDPFFADVISLLHLNGTNGSTVITDVIGKTWSASGTAALDTSFIIEGTASLNSGNDRITSASDGADSFGTGDFTIEFMFRDSGFAGGDVMFDMRDASTYAGNPAIYTSGGTIFFYAASGNRITGSSLSINTTYHIAVSRVSGVTRMFVDGVQVGSNYADSNSYNNVQMHVGAQYNGAGITSAIYDEVRVTKAGRYSANFTPPTGEFPDF